MSEAWKERREGNSPGERGVNVEEEEQLIALGSGGGGWQRRALPEVWLLWPKKAVWSCGEESFWPESKRLCFGDNVGDPSTDSTSWERALRTTSWTISVNRSFDTPVTQMQLPFMGLTERTHIQYTSDGVIDLTSHPDSIKAPQMYCVQYKRMSKALHMVGIYRRF